MKSYVWWAVIVVGIAALVFLCMNWNTLGVTSAPLNASGYTYPGTPGA